MARALRRNHQHVEILAGLNKVKVHVETMREEQRRALLHIGLQFVAVNIGLQFVRRQHHDDIGPFRGFHNRHHLQALALGLLDRWGTGAQRHHNVLAARVAQIQRMGMALRAVADNGDILALDEIDVGVTIIINTHVEGSLKCVVLHK